ncbi:Retrotransposon-derived protein PEG10, partial [Smittium culicis]
MDNTIRTPNPRPFFPETNQEQPDNTMNLNFEPEANTEANPNLGQTMNTAPLPEPFAFPDITAVPATKLIPETTLKLPDAVRFDGSSSSYKAFISSMSLYFWARPEIFNEDRNRIVYIGAHLSGSATVWFGNLITDNSPTIHSFSLFIQEFSRNFSDPSEGIRARGQIRKLRQGARSVAAYASEFKTLARDSGYDQLALVDQFLRGL